MRPKININTLKHLPTVEDMFTNKYGAKGTASRDEFDAKSRAWYYAEILKNARVSAGITQQQLADKIGKFNFFAVYVRHRKILIITLLFSSESPRIGRIFLR